MQSTSHSQTAQVWSESIDFYTGWFLNSILQMDGEGVGGRDIISLSLPTAPFTHSQQGANYNPYLSSATSKCPHWLLPIDIQISDCKKGGWYFHFLLWKDTMVCWWYYPFPHSCIPRLVGRQCDSCQCRLLMAVFLFTHQNTENINSNELFLPQSIKTPAVRVSGTSHTRVCLLYSWLMCGW